jgi:hypothetical protein
VTCVVHAGHDFEDAQLISSSERQAITQVAAQSDCGK